MQKTKLSWPDYKQAALKLRSKGLGFPKIYDRLGIPVWDGKEYKLESDKGGIKRKSRAAARAGKAASTKTRTSNQAISTPEGTDTRATNRLVKQINAAGGQADHVAELSRTGNAMRDMTPERRQQMQQRFGQQIGHQEGNIQYLTPEDNLQKNIDYRRLDSRLRKLGKTPNVGKPNFLFRGGQVRFTGGMMPGVIGYVEPVVQMVNERTDGGIDKAIDSAVEPLRKGVQRLVDGAVGFYVDMKDIGFDLELQ